LCFALHPTNVANHFAITYEITSKKELFTERFSTNMLIILTEMIDLSLVDVIIIEKKYSVEYNWLQENHDDVQVTTCCFAHFSQICW
jgi:hypothetical protein